MSIDCFDKYNLEQFLDGRIHCVDSVWVNKKIYLGVFNVAFTRSNDCFSLSLFGVDGDQVACFTGDSNLADCSLSIQNFSLDLVDSFGSPLEVTLVNIRL